jgi:hypothetical protein
MRDLIATNREAPMEKAAGIADYPNRNNDCPSGHSAAYCVGWTSGYNIGFNAQTTIEESGGGGGSDDNNGDDDNN